MVERGDQVGLRRDGFRFVLSLPPGATFALLECGIIVCEPDKPVMLYRYRDDGPLVGEVLRPDPHGNA